MILEKVYNLINEIKQGSFREFSSYANNMNRSTKPPSARNPTAAQAFIRNEKEANYKSRTSKPSSFLKKVAGKKFGLRVGSINKRNEHQFGSGVRLKHKEQQSSFGITRKK